MEPKRTGRPSKGVRRLVRTRVPPQLHDAFAEEAKRRGMTVNDFLGELMSRETGVPYTTQEALKTA